MNIFRLAGDVSHLLAIVILLVKIWRSKSCAGKQGTRSILPELGQCTESVLHECFCLCVCVCFFVFFCPPAPEVSGTGVFCLRFNFCFCITPRFCSGAQPRQRRGKTFAERLAACATCDASVWRCSRSRELPTVRFAGDMCCLSHIPCAVLTFDFFLPPPLTPCRYLWEISDAVCPRVYHQVPRLVHQLHLGV